MPGLSIHVVDVSRGVVAEGMQVSVSHLAGDPPSATVLAAGRIDKGGQLANDALRGRLPPGRYRATFAVVDYYRAAGIALPAVPFLDSVNYDFGIDDPDQHYHLPFKCTPWGYSCFRGGA